MTFKEIFRENYDYRLSHKAPCKDEDFPNNSLDNPSDIYPEDLYSPMGWRYYTSGYPDIDKKCHKLFIKYHNKPNAKVTIYRAVPKNVQEINPGDWVTICKKYAEIHGNANLRNGYHIIEKTVKASQLFTEGNSLAEFGYCP